MNLLNTDRTLEEANAKLALLTDEVTLTVDVVDGRIYLYHDGELMGDQGEGHATVAEAFEEAMACWEEVVTGEDISEDYPGQHIGRECGCGATRENVDHAVWCFGRRF